MQAKKGRYKNIKRLYFTYLEEFLPQRNLTKLGVWVGMLDMSRAKCGNNQFNEYTVTKGPFLVTDCATMIIIATYTVILIIYCYIDFA